MTRCNRCFESDGVRTYEFTAKDDHADWVGELCEDCAEKIRRALNDENYKL